MYCACDKKRQIKEKKDTLEEIFREAKEIVTLDAYIPPSLRTKIKIVKIKTKNGFVGGKVVSIEKK